MKLTAQSLVVRYGERTAVQATDLAMDAGQLIGLVGPNGAGKTSLLRGLAGLVPCEGRVDWNGNSLSQLPRRRHARTIGYLSQAPRAHWPLRVRELVELGRLPHRAYGRALDEADRDAVDWALERTGTEPLSARRIDSLSGGELMRVQLARALAVQAPVLLVDEPVTSLDPYHQLKIMQVLREYASDQRLVVAVLHDLSLAARHCSRLLLMNAGSIEEDGLPGDVLTDATLARHYHIKAYLAEHEGELVAVPWRQID